MKIILYDGTFDGLMTVVFDYYKEIFYIKIEKESSQMDFLEKIFVKTDINKAKRVKNAIKDKFSQNFLFHIRNNFKSKDSNKDKLIGIIIKLSFTYGKDFIKSANKYAVRFRENSKNYLSECHSYKGLLRFRQIQDGYLFAEFQPQNNILEDLSRHFLKRMPKEKFIIYDKNRKKALIAVAGNCELVDIVDLKIKDTDKEKLFKSLRIKFYDTIAIKQRANEKLMVSNMPKKYWKYLPEKNREEK